MPAARPTTAVIRNSGALRPFRPKSKPQGEPLEVSCWYAAFWPGHGATSQIPRTNGSRKPAQAKPEAKPAGRRRPASRTKPATIGV